MLKIDIIADISSQLSQKCEEYFRYFALISVMVYRIVTIQVQFPVLWKYFYRLPSKSGIAICSIIRHR